MPNDLCVAVAGNKETFIASRVYLLENSMTKEQIVQLENSHINILLPYYISFIESRGIKMTEAMAYYHYTYPDLTFWNLIRVAVIDIFRKIEVNDINFIPY